MTQVTATYTVTFWNGSTWVDITADCAMNPITFNWGMADNKAITNLASTGQCTFTLKNTGQKYVPGIGNALVGWDLGTPIMITFTYDGVNYNRWRGLIASPGGLVPHGEITSILNVDVIALDWMNIPATYPLTNPLIKYGYSADMAIDIVEAALPIQPVANNLDIGNVVFPSVFDAVSEKTTGYEEIQKMTLSEMGMTYLQHDKANGETLVFENNTHRSGVTPIGQIPQLSSFGDWELESGAGHWALENGAGAWQLDATTNNVINATVGIGATDGVAMTYGDQLVNRIVINTYPKTNDTNVVTLFSLQLSSKAPSLKIASGASHKLGSGYVCSSA